MISINAKRIIRCENKCKYDCCKCYKSKSIKEGIPEYYYLTNCMLWAVYSSEDAIPITISMNALGILYRMIKSYFISICCTTDCVDVSSQEGLRAYATAVNDQITDFQISTTS